MVKNNFANMWTVLVLVLLTVHLGQIQANETEVTQKTRVRRQYYVCPPGFKRISNNCYYFSPQMATWQEAHYDCRDRYSDLAKLLTAAEDQKLRSQLNKPSVTPLEWWIGGIYDWEQMKWKWGASGKLLGYQGFSRMDPEHTDKLKWHCIILDPAMKYKWSARSCVLGKHYICQTKVDKVGERGLRKLRKKYKVDKDTRLNKIAAPIYEKPYKLKGHRRENLSNGQGRSGLKHHRPNGVEQSYDSNTLENAFALRNNATTTELRLARKRERKNRKGKGRKNRNKNRNHKNLQLYARNGTDFSLMHADTYDERNARNRRRRNKSKELNSDENSTLLLQELKKKKNHTVLGQSKQENSMENITQKTTYVSNTISPLHPRVIIEEHDFIN